MTSYPVAGVVAIARGESLAPLRHRSRGILRGARSNRARRELSTLPAPPVWWRARQVAWLTQSAGADGELRSATCRRPFESGAARGTFEQDRSACAGVGGRRNAGIADRFLGFSVVASGHNDLGTFTGKCQPSISTKMLLSASFINSAVTGSDCGVFIDNFPGSSSIAGSGLRGFAPAAGAATINYAPVSFTPRSGAELWAQLNSGNGVIQLYAMGFNHRVNRISVGY